MPASENISMARKKAISAIGPRQAGKVRDVLDILAVHAHRQNGGE